MNYETIADWGVRVGILVIGIMLTQGLDKLNDISHDLRMMDTRLTVVEKTRFTAADGRDLEDRRRAEVNALARELKVCLNRIQRNQPCDL